MAPHTKSRSVKEDQTQRQAREVELFKEITAETSQSSDLAGILNHSLQRALGLVGIDRGGIYLLDEHASLLKVAACCGLTAAFVDQIDCLKVGEGFSGQVAQTGQPLIIQDLANDPRLTRIAVAEAGLRSVAMVPIRSKGKILGTLFAITSGYREFQPLEVDLLTSVGSQIGVAIENARLYAAEQRRSEQFRVIAEIGRRLTLVLDLDELLKQVVTVIQQALGYYHVDWEQAVDKLPAAAGQPEAEQQKAAAFRPEAGE